MPRKSSTVIDLPYKLQLDLIFRQL